MEQWEYWPTYLEAKANKKEMKEYLKSKVPDLKRPPKFMVESLMPQLNEMGEQGWELVHMEPVPGLDNRGRARFGGREWSNVYFCVFKRRRAGTAPVVMPVNAAGQPAFPVPNQPATSPQPPASPPPTTQPQSDT